MDSNEFYSPIASCFFYFHLLSVCHTAPLISFFPFQCGGAQKQQITMDLTVDGAVFFDGGWSDLDSACENFHSTVLSDVLWKKFELLETPPLSPSRQDDESLSPVNINVATSISFSNPESPPDSEDELDTPLAGEDCMWSSFSSPVAGLPPVLSGSSSSPVKGVQLRFKLTDEATTERLFPYPLSEHVLAQPASLKRPADSGKATSLRVYYLLMVVCPPPPFFLGFFLFATLQDDGVNQVA